MTGGGFPRNRAAEPTALRPISERDVETDERFALESTELGQLFSRLLDTTEHVGDVLAKVLPEMPEPLVHGMASFSERVGDVLVRVLPEMPEPLVRRMAFVSERVGDVLAKGVHKIL